MSWLNSIGTLAHLLERQAHHWICFLQFESPHVARHPQATDQSCGAVTQPHEGEPWVRCFFAAQPVVECCEFVARDFYSHPAVRNAASGAFLIPYSPLDEFDRPQSVPFLKFACENFLELSGTLHGAEPRVRARGTVLDRCLSDLREQLLSGSPPSTGAVLQKKATDHRSDASWSPSESKQSLREMFESLMSLMRDGESYLANASTRLYGPTREQVEVSLSAFVSSWLQSPSRFGVFVSSGAEVPAILCFSPERFVQREGGRIVTEPIKGTAKANAAEQCLGASALWNSTKEMCEQKMVTDLLRNDLNALCVPGSVCVEAPFAMRCAGELLQMQSVISGQLQEPQIAHADIFRSMLPAGSVIGTPKFAVGQQLRALEKSQRLYYTGVFALADDAQNFESTLLIRGFFAGKELWEVGLGAGITALSDVDFELAEFDLKWQSFAQRWLAASARTDSISDTEGCRWLLGAQVMQQHNVHQSAVAAPCAALKQLSPSIALDANELCNHILFVDHLDSFSWNLLAALRAQGCPTTRVVSHPAKNEFAQANTQELSASCAWEELLVDFAAQGVFSALVFSPGPGRPEDYPLSQNLLRHWPHTKPLLGVCLGHQLLLTDAGCSLRRAGSRPAHGRAQSLLMAEQPQWLTSLSLEPQECTFYNSWNIACDEAQLRAPQWRVCASVADVETPDKPASMELLTPILGNSVALCEHRKNPWIGMQFHPESFATVPGKSLIAAFVALCRGGA